MINAVIEMVDGVMVVSPKVEKFEPEDGDVLNADGSILIFRCIRGSVNKSLESYAILTPSGLYIDKIVNYKCLKYATKEEVQTLFNKLKDEGLEFDPEKRGIVKLKWKPEIDEKYYHPILQPEKGDIKFSVVLDNYRNTDFDEVVYNNGWAFKTREECKVFCDKLNQAINSVKP